MDLSASSEGRRQERVPLDALIELRTGDGHQKLEADGLDVSLGGLSARASFVPAIGTRLRCAFRCPPRQEAVQADAEVIWSEWCGPGAGAFGVRFLELDTRGAMAIRSLVAPEPKSGSLELSLPTATRLFIDGLSASVDTDLKVVDDCRVVLEQELSFLKLGRGVEVELPGKQGQRGRIASVELRLGARDVPTLVFGVLLDEVREEAPITALAPTGPAPVAAEPIEDTEVDVEAEPQAALGPCDTWPEKSAFADDDANGSVEEGTEFPLGLVAREPLALSAAESAVHAHDDEAERFAGALRPEPLALKRAAELWRAARAFIRLQLLPTLRTALVAARTLVARHAPGLRARSAKFAAQARAFAVVQSDRVQSLRAASREKQARRTTVAVPRAQRVPPRSERPAPASAAKPARPRNQRMWAVALAAVGIALGIYALAPRSEAKRLGQDTAAPQPLAAELPSAHPDPEGSPSGAPQALGAPSAAGASQPVPATAAQPLPAGFGVGPLGSQLGSSPAEQVREVATGAAPARDVPARAAEREPDNALAMSFGADQVRDGRSYVLRMSGPVSGLEGESREGGFSVRIPGRLALDRASPIATTHRAVARAMILNRGDYAELTIDFLPGMRPQYRVSAKESAIEVTLERL